MAGDPFSAITPAAAGFDNPYETSYANYLATSPADPSPYQILNGAVLRNNAGTHGRGDYLAALREAQQTQLQGSQNKYDAEVQQHAIDAYGTVHSRTGGGDSVLTPVINRPDPFTGKYLFDPTALAAHSAQNDSVDLDETSARAMQARLTGLSLLAREGFAPDNTPGPGGTPGYLDAITGGPNDAHPGHYSKYITPTNQAELTKAMAAVTTSNASMIRANKGVGDGGGGTTTVNLGPVSGMDTVSVKQGKHESTTAYHARLAIERKAHEAAGIVGGSGGVAPTTRPGYLGSDNKWHTQ